MPMQPRPRAETVSSVPRVRRCMKWCSGIGTSMNSDAVVQVRRYLLRAELLSRRGRFAVDASLWTLRCGRFAVDASLWTLRVAFQRRERGFWRIERNGRIAPGGRRDLSTAGRKKSLG